MPNRYHMSFGPNQEEFFITNENKLHTAPLGSFLFDFLSADFKVYQAQLSNHVSRDVLLSLIPDIRESISAIHPLFADLMLSFDPSSDDSLGWLKEKIGGILHLQDQLIQRTEQVLCTDDGSLTALQKYYLLLCKDPLTRKDYHEKNSVLSLERKIFNGTTEFVPALATATTMVPQDLTTMVLCSSSDFDAITHAYFEHLVESNFRVRRCDYCGRYFHPFSKRAIYCDRPVGNTGKTCKELAAQRKHNEKVSADEGLSLFRKNNKAYAMRVHRAPNIYKDADYQKWRSTAEIALEKYKNGEITFGTLEVFLKLPDTKKA